METFVILARLEAKPGKEKEVLEFLKSALPLAEGEPGTIRWYALQIGPSTFGIFDTFETEQGREAHLNGPIAAALMAFFLSSCRILQANGLSQEQEVFLLTEIFIRKHSATAAFPNL